MNSLVVLIKREFWEHRSAFLIVPAVVTLFLLVMLALAFSLSATAMIEMTVDLNDEEMALVEQQFSSNNQVALMLSGLEGMTDSRRAEVIGGSLRALSLPLVVVLWAVIFFYLLACLYDERRDRSILFWKSMPVSDARTILAKLITGLLAVPVVYLLGIALLQFVGLVLLTLVALKTELDVIETIWIPAGLLGQWAGYVAAVLFYSLWSLPFFAWLLTVSAAAKNLPLAWALGVPFALMLGERIFTGQSLVSDWMWRHVIPLNFLSTDQFSWSALASRAFSPDMLSAVLVGATFTVVAVWLRGRAAEI